MTPDSSRTPRMVEFQGGGGAIQKELWGWEWEAARVGGVPVSGIP